MNSVYYSVVKVGICVAAENETEAIDKIRHHLVEATDSCPVTFAAKITSLMMLPEEWHDAIPFGLAYADDQTVRDIVEKETKIREALAKLTSEEVELLGLQV
jgi:DNA recombination-dependent growth factor C